MQTALLTARRITEPAGSAEVERAVRTLQVTKGKTYAKAIEKETGRVPEGLADIGITAMLLAMQITHAELDAWYKSAETTKYQFTIYAPLPEKADARALLDEIRAANVSRRMTAENLLEMHQKSQEKPEKVQLSISGLRTSLELGLWSLMFPEQRQAVWMLLRWDELTHAAKWDYFKSLPRDERARILHLATPDEREARTRELFKLHYDNQDMIKKENDREHE
ncbi:MAG: hypothetical protein HGB00_08325 [Chlorobiaceae bacterium]|nr:hypothetical protein [Chlorobiaceae bacterium]